MDSTELGLENSVKLTTSILFKLVHPHFWW